MALSAPSATTMPRPSSAPERPKPGTVHAYYSTLESRLGYALVLRDTRHFGLYASSKSWPFPISRALRAMEDSLLTALSLPAGSLVLDAGCGSGRVAARAATSFGLRVLALDYTPAHVRQAQAHITSLKLSPRDPTSPTQSTSSPVQKARGSVTVSEGDYHSLPHASATLDGIYTMETLVHSPDPAAVLREFYRVLRPGGRLALHEYDHPPYVAGDKDAERLREVNKWASMPGCDLFEAGVLERLLREAGFEEVRLVDLSSRVTPMLRLFYVLGIVPYKVFGLLGVRHRFVNTMAGVESYKRRDGWRYVQVTAVKPLTSKQA